MNNYTEYFNGKDSLANKEEKLNELIDYLDKESFELFKEIVDLGPNSFYKNEELVKRLKELVELSDHVIYGTDYLIKNNKDKRKSDFKFYLKLSLLGASSVGVFYLSPVFSIIYLFIFIDKFDNKHDKEIAEIKEHMKSLTTDKLGIINTTIGNSCRILNGKLDKLGDIGLYDSLANLYIESCFNGTNPEIESCSEEFQNRIRAILKKDLNTDENDINELIIMAKDKREKSLLQLKRFNW